MTDNYIGAPRTMSMVKSEREWRDIHQMVGHAAAEPRRWTALPLNGFSSKGERDDYWYADGHAPPSGSLVEERRAAAKRWVAGFAARKP